MFRHGFRRVLSQLAAPQRLPAVLAVAVSTEHFRSASHASHASHAACQVQREGRPIIIDTDPGVDDALAILLALASDALSVQGISITMGNGKDIRALGSNAKLLLRLANAEVPVSLGDGQSGSPGAVVSRTGMKAQPVHGVDHLGNVGKKYGKCDADYQHFHPLPASEFIYDLCSSFPGQMTVVCIGSLHNLAKCLESHPDLPQLVREVVIMGGAFGLRRGNRTPAAEANFFDGPEAAQAVLTANFPKVVLAGLDVTQYTDMAVLRQGCIESSSPLSQFVWDLCENFMNVYHDWGEALAPAHDTVPIMYLLRPELFEGQEVRVEVETKGELTRGMSIADWKGQWNKAPNCVVLKRIVDRDAYTKAFVEAIGRLPRK